MLTSDRVAKISDPATARRGAGPKLTETGGVVGTIDYVAPEYLEDGSVDLRSDIYAVGVLAYQLTTGRAPFEEESVIGTMTARLNAEPVPPEETCG